MLNSSSVIQVIKAFMHPKCDVTLYRDTLEWSQPCFTEVKVRICKKNFVFETYIYL